jgi:hypothetical protein
MANRIEHRIVFRKIMTLLPKLPKPVITKKQKFICKHNTLEMEMEMKILKFKNIYILLGLARIK